MPPAVELARATRSVKDAGLYAMADALDKAETAVLEANAVDVARAEAAGTSPALIDRLRLNPDRIAGMAEGLRGLAGAARPGRRRGARLDERQRGAGRARCGCRSGWSASSTRRGPNVTADAAGICLKSGNAALLRGSSSAADSNAAIVEALQAGLADAGLPADAVQLVPGPREVTAELMAARGLVDVLIPRGGAGLIETVVRNSQVPVIETGVGNCHLYVDASADEQMALDDPAQRQGPAALGVQRGRDPAGARRPRADLPAPGAAGAGRGRGDGARRRAGDRVRDRGAGRGDRLRRPSTCRWTSRRRSSTRSTRALHHIRRYSTGHSETIMTDSQRAAQRFTAEVDAAAVLVNASSRFVDGGEFGFGAEIGISTQKLHARGPMGLPEMTSTKYVVTGLRAGALSSYGCAADPARVRVRAGSARGAAMNLGLTLLEAEAHRELPIPAWGFGVIAFVLLMALLCADLVDRQGPPAQLVSACAPAAPVATGLGLARPAADPHHRHRLGVMGGTFDPIHHGHLVAASEVASRFDLDEVVFVPTGQPWQKADRHGVRGRGPLPDDGDRDRVQPALHRQPGGHRPAAG